MGRCGHRSCNNIVQQHALAGVFGHKGKVCFLCKQSFCAEHRVAACVECIPQYVNEHRGDRVGLGLADAEVQHLPPETVREWRAMSKEDFARKLLEEMKGTSFLLGEIRGLRQERADLLKDLRAADSRKDRLDGLSYELTRALESSRAMMARMEQVRVKQLDLLESGFEVPAPDLAAIMEKSDDPRSAREAASMWKAERQIFKMNKDFSKSKENEKVQRRRARQCEEALRAVRDGLKNAQEGLEKLIRESNAIKRAGIQAGTEPVRLSTSAAALAVSTATADVERKRRLATQAAAVQKEAARQAEKAEEERVLLQKKLDTFAPTGGGSLTEKQRSAADGIARPRGTSSLRIRIRDSSSFTEAGLESRLEGRRRGGDAGSLPVTRKDADGPVGHPKPARDLGAGSAPAALPHLASEASEKPTSSVTGRLQRLAENPKEEALALVNDAADLAQSVDRYTAAVFRAVAKGSELGVEAALLDVCIFALESDESDEPTIRYALESICSLESLSFLSNVAQSVVWCVNEHLRTRGVLEAAFKALLHLMEGEEGRTAVSNTAAIELICTVLENFPHDPALASLAFQCLMQLVEGSALNAHLALRCGIVEKAANIHASIGSENGDLAGLACKMMNALMDASRETEALFLESNWPRILTGSLQGHLSHIDTLRQATRLMAKMCKIKPHIGKAQKEHCADALQAGLVLHKTDDAFVRDACETVSLLFRGDAAVQQAGSSMVELLVRTVVCHPTAPETQEAVLVALAAVVTRSEVNCRLAHGVRATESCVNLIVQYPENPAILQACMLVLANIAEMVPEAVAALQDLNAILLALEILERNATSIILVRLSLRLLGRLCSDSAEARRRAVRAGVLDLAFDAVAPAMHEAANALTYLNLLGVLCQDGFEVAEHRNTLDAILTSIELYSAQGPLVKKACSIFKQIQAGSLSEAPAGCLKALLPCFVQVMVTRNEIETPSVCCEIVGELCLKDAELAALAGGVGAVDATLNHLRFVAAARTPDAAGTETALVALTRMMIAGGDLRERFMERADELVQVLIGLAEVHAANPAVMGCTCKALSLLMMDHGKCLDILEAGGMELALQAIDAHADDGRLVGRSIEMVTIAADVGPSSDRDSAAAGFDAFARAGRAAIRAGLSERSNQKLLSTCVGAASKILASFPDLVATFTGEGLLELIHLALEAHVAQKPALHLDLQLLTRVLLASPETRADGGVEALLLPVVAKVAERHHGDVYILKPCLAALTSLSSRTRALTSAAAGSAVAVVMGVIKNTQLDSRIVASGCRALASLCKQTPARRIARDIGALDLCVELQELHDTTEPGVAAERAASVLGGMLDLEPGHLRAHYREGGWAGTPAGEETDCPGAMTRMSPQAQRAFLRGVERGMRDNSQGPQRQALLRANTAAES